MLEELNNFLSSSTIHGLAHIPTSKRLWRVFWISIVIAGFSVSALLIWMSFKGWQESPITTSIAIQPLRELQFPRITVCPPRDTATSLNLHLHLADSLVLSNQTRQLLTEYFYQNALEIGYDELFRNLTKYLESDGLRKWYEGVSNIRFPYYHTGYSMMYYRYKTIATQGELSTPFFGQPWNLTNFDKGFYYHVDIYGPWDDTVSDWTQSNVSIVVELEQDVLNELSAGYDEVISGDWVFHRGETKINKTHKVGGTENYFWFALRRKISDEDTAQLNREKIPGLRVKWRYNGSVAIDKSYHSENRNFVRLVNIVHSSQSLGDIWTAATEAKRLSLEGISKYCIHNMIKDSIVGDRLDLIEARLGVETRDEVLQTVTSASLLTAAEIYTHLVYCSIRTRIKSWMSLYPRLLREHSAKTIIMSLARIANRVTQLDNQFEYLIAQRMLMKVWEVLQLPEFTPDIAYEDEQSLEMMNHPVHLIDGEGKLLPSALIPFCDFGGDMSWIGKKIEEFDLPVCNSFRRSLLKGQLCYELDVNQTTEQQFSGDQLRMGLTLLMDNNEDRMISDKNNTGQSLNSEKNLIRNIIDFEELHKAYIHIDTINPIELYGEGHYGLANVKEIRVTHSYLNMGTSITGCQNVESREKCNSRKFAEVVLSKCNCVPFGKERRCGRSEQACVARTPLEYEDCLPMCEGLSISNFDKDTIKNYRKLDEKLKNLMNQYSRYKNLFEEPVEFPVNLKGRYEAVSSFYNCHPFEEFSDSPGLQVVRIYFDTPTFDRITKDERAKFEDMLSTVGGEWELVIARDVRLECAGTLGLLTGFSIISGVEILYFIFKILLGLFYRGNTKGLK